MPAKKTVAQKLMIKEGRSVLLINPPSGYETTLGPLPAGATLTTEANGPVDLIQAFVDSRQELEARLGPLKALLKPGGILWLTYHKGTSKIKTDINRDSIAAYAQTLGFAAVAMIAIDDDWSALRLKRVD